MNREKWNCKATLTARFKRDSDGTCVLEEIRCVYIKKQVGKRKYFDVDLSPDKLPLLLDMNNYDQTLHFHTGKCKSISPSGHCNSTKHTINCYSEENDDAQVQRDFRHALKEKAGNPANRKLNPTQLIAEVQREISDTHFQGVPISQIANYWSMKGVFISNEKQSAHRSKGGNIDPHQCHPESMLMSYMTDPDTVKTEKFVHEFDDCTLFCIPSELEKLDGALANADGTHRHSNAINRLVNKIKKTYQQT